MWKIQVACPDRFCAETCAFLDEYADRGKLSRAGTFTLLDTVSELVPYELLPLRIKKLVNLIPIDRAKFNNMHSYKRAILNLYVYGYLPDADKAIVVREQHWRAVRRKWHIDNPGCRAKPDAEQRDRIVAYAKANEDLVLYKQAVAAARTSSSSLLGLETSLVPTATP